MNCPVCNQLIPDDSVVCEHCGSPLSYGNFHVASQTQKAQAVGTSASPYPAGSSATAPTQPAPTAASKTSDAGSDASGKKPGAKYASVGIFVGVLCLVTAALAFVITPEAVRSTSFGADFYT